MASGTLESFRSLIALLNGNGDITGKGPRTMLVQGYNEKGEPCLHIIERDGKEEKPIGKFEAIEIVNRDVFETMADAIKRAQELSEKGILVVVSASDIDRMTDALRQAGVAVESRNIFDTSTTPEMKGVLKEKVKNLGEEKG